MLAHQAATKPRKTQLERAPSRDRAARFEDGGDDWEGGAGEQPILPSPPPRLRSPPHTRPCRLAFRPFTDAGRPCRHPPTLSSPPVCLAGAGTHWRRQGLRTTTARPTPPSYFRCHNPVRDLAASPLSGSPILEYPTKTNSTLTLPAGLPSFAAQGVGGAVGGVARNIVFGVGDEPDGDDGGAEVRPPSPEPIPSEAGRALAEVEVTRLRPATRHARPRCHQELTFVHFSAQLERVV